MMRKEDAEEYRKRVEERRVEERRNKNIITNGSYNRIEKLKKTGI